jgi:phage-related baseplate assembly protein
MLLAYARTTNLDNAAAFYEVERQLITPADLDAYPPVEAVYESDDDFRRRIQLSVEGFSTAGPTGGYKFHALSASPSVRDADVYSPTPGQVEVTILASEGDGTADEPLLETVYNALNDEFIRPLNDEVFVNAASIVNYSINATLTFFSGPDRSVVLAAAQAAVEAYALNQHKMGMDITVSGIHAALHQPGVQNVSLTTPTADISIDHNQAPYCTGITLTDGGIDE